MVELGSMTKSELARKLGKTRVTLDNWLGNPEKMPVWAYQQMIGMGVMLPPIEPLLRCDKCNGSGMIRSVAPPEVKKGV